jgi:hypothetical protein
VLTDVKGAAASVPLHDLVEVTDGVKPSVLDAAWSWHAGSAEPLAAANAWVRFWSW